MYSVALGKLRKRLTLGQLYGTQNSVRSNVVLRCAMHDNPRADRPLGLSITTKSAPPQLR